MDHAERIAREAHAQSWPSFRWESDSTGDVKYAMLRAARLGIEHGERASAAKIADMRRALERIGLWRTATGDEARDCLARNFAEPKPSLREAQEMACKAVLAYEEWIKSERHLLGSTRRAHVDTLEAAHALRDALAREGVKP